MREFQSYYDPQVAFKFAATTGDTDGEIIDRKDATSGAVAQALDFVVFTGSVTTADATNYLAPVLYESDAADMSGATAVAADDLVVDNRDNEGPTPGATPRSVNNTNLLDSILCRISYRGNKRYTRLKMDETGTASAQVGAIVNRFLESMAPSASSF